MKQKTASYYLPQKKALKAPLIIDTAAYKKVISPLRCGRRPF